MARRRITDEQKKREGAALAAAYEAAKVAEPSLTQDALMAEIGVTQGLFGQWCSGLTPIPDKRLVWLGGRLGFDPFALRPELVTYMLPSKIKKGRGEVIAKLLRYCETASDQDFRRFAAVLDAFVGETDNHPEKP